MVAWNPPKNRAGVNAQFENFTNYAITATNPTRADAPAVLRHTGVWFWGDDSYQNWFHIMEKDPYAFSRHATDPTRIWVQHSNQSYNIKTGETVVFGAQASVTASLTMGTGCEISTKKLYVVEGASVSGTLISVGVTCDSATTIAAPNLWRMLHNNFFVSAQVPRWQLAADVSRATEWVRGGGWFYHGGLHTTYPDWHFYRRFYTSAVIDSIVSDSFHWYAGKYAATGIMTPEKVLIGFENEPTCEWADYQVYLHDVVHPLLRAEFPEHTIAYSGTDYKSPAKVRASVSTWPVTDTNTLLEIHFYPGVGTNMDFATTTDASTLVGQMTSCMARLQATGNAPGGWFIGEFGVGRLSGYGTVTADREGALNRVLTAAFAGGAEAAMWWVGKVGRYDDALSIFYRDNGVWVIDPALPRALIVGPRGLVNSGSRIFGNYRIKRPNLI